MSVTTTTTTTAATAAAAATPTVTTTACLLTLAKLFNSDVSQLLSCVIWCLQKADEYSMAEKWQVYDYVACGLTACRLASALDPPLITEYRTFMMILPASSAAPVGGSVS